MPETYDVLVLGSGVAGGVAARALCRAGLKVAVVDHRPFGGTCPLRGCEPKKVFFDIADAKARAHSAFGHGLDGEVRIDWPSLQRFKRSFTDPVPQSVEKGFTDLGITSVHARASFSGPRSLLLSDGREIEGEKIVIATGAVPRPLTFPGVEHLATSDDFLELDRLPKRLLFVGGGYISFEFAHVAVKAGAQVDIIQRGSRCLKHFDPDLVALLCATSHESGISIHYEAPIFSIEKHGAFFEVRAGEKGEKRFEADLVVHGAGRVAAVDGLALDRGGVQGDTQGIVVNEYMQSVSNPSVYAAGDVTEQGLQLTPVALLEAELAVHNILHGNERRIDYTGVSGVLFTHPVLATVGSQESELEQQKIPFRKRFKETSEWAPYRRIGERASGAKILIHSELGTILGAHLLGHQSQEVINIFGMAMRQGLTVDQLKGMVWSYPSFGYTLLRNLLT
jgi:glutathione reductase (NADPH)